ncbi:hypothetical protein [Streptomyces spectabilis]|uniref:Uncharacterized protein n=1 Tax=Streptomyces spectabilis TaxID=68270 RepID=A0A5P2X9P9_STRST|nr:hypothetical protein [Streptomyces spectabilis]MBB5109501.1 hypothetical protein [Streptomyces spectabilis]MCI3904628.1 hypothetical protein [Streptomyces spectabilis]QEV61707.1 hypothetical protein CP982_25835 [Streptomyces spectabilis]GGV54569.1 hypothetical protein GCM10010245_86250 [Streptomyces spectabilis]
MTSFAPGFSGVGTSPQQQHGQSPFQQQGQSQLPPQLQQQLQQFGQQQPFQGLLQQMGQQPGTQPQTQFQVGYAQAVRAPIVPFPGYERAMILLVDGRPVQLLDPSEFAIQSIVFAIQTGQAVRVAYDDRMLVRGVEIEVPRGVIQQHAQQMQQSQQSQQPQQSQQSQF